MKNRFVKTKIKTHILIASVAFISNHEVVCAQESNNIEKVGFNSISYEEISQNGQTLNEIERKVLFNKEFTTALSDVSTNYIGNYASVNVGATKASFATSFVGNGSVFGFNISGSTSDGTLKFVNNNKLNYNLDLGFQYHLIDASKKIYFVVDQEDWDSKRMQRKKLLSDAIKKEDVIRKGENLKSLVAKKSVLEAQIVEIDKKIQYMNVTSLQIGDKKRKSIDRAILLNKQESVKQRLVDLKQYQNYLTKKDSIYSKRKLNALERIENCFTDNCIKERVELLNDTDVKNTYLNKESLELELAKLEKAYEGFEFSEHEKKLNKEKVTLANQLKKLENEINYLKNNKELLISLEGTKLQEALEKHDRSAIQTYGSRFNWFSIGAKAGLKSFILYDSEAPAERQLIPKETANLELTLQYSWHSQNQLKQWKSYLINTGLSIMYGDNLNLLSLVTLENQNTLSSTDTTTRITKDEISVFTGNYRDDITGLKIYTDIYYFLFNGNYAAIHLYPTASFNQFQKPLFRTEIGLLLSYKDRDKLGSVVNAELFYSLNDLGNRDDSDLNLLGRNTVGLRLTIPIKFKYLP